MRIPPIDKAIYKLRDAEASIEALGFPDGSELVNKLREVQKTLSERYMKSEHEKEKGERTKL